MAKITIKDLTKFAEKSNYHAYVPEKNDLDAGKFKKLNKDSELLSIVKDFIKDFETDYVLNGKIVDNPNELLVKYYKKFKNVK